MNIWKWNVVAVLAAMQWGAAAAESQTVTVSAGKHDRVNAPVRATIAVPENRANETLATLVGPEGESIVGQLTAPGLSSSTKNKASLRELHFLLPKLGANQSATYEVRFGAATPDEAFAWHDESGKFAELRLGATPALRYVYQAFDDSNPERRFETYKAFHHLFDRSGEQLVTNGPLGDGPYTQDTIRYPHHRGIFYGFNRCSYEGVARADVWHCQGDDFQGHAKTLASEAGPVLGRHRVSIDWNGKGKKPFATEEREVAIYAYPDGWLLEFASVVESKVGKVKLDGDPQHAGFQFRARNEVAAKTSGQTYYIRPDGKGKPGQTRNWPQDETQVDLPWKAMSFVLGDDRYTCVYLDSPKNPKQARFSERDYGRFGSYFEYELDDDNPLAVRYRLWFQGGEIADAEIARLSNDFVEPVSVRVD